MEKILVSACLLGDKVRYDGKSNYVRIIEKVKEYYEIIPFCAEVEGGLGTPRNPSEIYHGEVIQESGRKVTHQFNLGAKKALNIVNYLNIKTAILKESSPSCGVHEVHDGNFKGRKIKGQGVLTTLLLQNGVRVINENEIEDFLNEKEMKKGEIKTDK